MDGNIIVNHPTPLSLLGASKIFWTYMLPCFLLENMKKIVFQTSNLPLAFQKKLNFFFSWASLASL
jgi:hypothetical protein